jgi:hypothetical protein
VLYYFAPLFYRATVDLHDLRRQVAMLVQKFGHERFIDEHKSLREPVSRLFADLKRECERIKLEEPLQRLYHSRVQTLYSLTMHSTMKLGELQHELNELHDAIDSALFMRRFYTLEPGEEKFFYDDPLRPLPEMFGEKVSLNFHSALEDVKEAGNCYATDRNTA